MNSVTTSPFAAVVLAAGEGTRMRSRRPKVLHEIAGRPMLGHVVAAATAAGAGSIAVVVGPHCEDVAKEAVTTASGAATFVQADRLGTAHAVLAARAALAANRDVVVLFGDTPLVRPETIGRLRDCLSGGAAVAVLGFEADDPTGYGRLILDGAGALVAIREERDASDVERKVRLCNAGIMALAGDNALGLLDAVGNANAKGEYYLTDVVSIARANGLAATYTTAPEQEVLGVNDRAQLAGAEQVIQQRLRAAHMRNGVTLQDPASTFFSWDTEIAADVTIEPHVVIAPGVRIGAGTVVHAFSHLAGADVGENVSVGPYARLRPGTALAASSRVGNFVETKAASIGVGAKVNHLTYIGDATVGAGANIGAGTITCNYDGFSKFRTEIGAGAFIGSNSSLVAPVTIGEGAYVGSGSVITDAVEPDALAVARGRQAAKAGWAAAFRAKNASRKKG